MKIKGMIAGLIVTANEAKDYGEFRLANEVFAYLLHKYARQRDNYSAEEEPPPLWFEWESDYHDMKEESSYYDLLVVGTWEGGRVETLCIPTPLLSEEALLVAIPGSVKVQRRRHNRHLKSSWRVNLQEFRQIVEGTIIALGEMPEYKEACERFLEKDEEAVA